jgi:hypothetical protein
MPDWYSKLHILSEPHPPSSAVAYWVGLTRGVKVSCPRGTVSTLHRAGCPAAYGRLVCCSSTVKTLIPRRICQPQCSGIKYDISSLAPIHATE